MSTEIDYVSETVDLLNQLSEKIEAGENIQFDVVSEILMVMESLISTRKRVSLQVCNRLCRWLLWVLPANTSLGGTSI